MIFSENRNDLRDFFFNSWQKYLAKETLQPLEQQIVEVIKLHPEYHPLLDNKEKYQDKDYLPELGESNPFLHMALHMSVLEQITTNRPDGMLDLYVNAIKIHHHDEHTVLHQMMEVLAEFLWQMQQQNKMLDEKDYLAALTARMTTLAKN